MSKNMSLLLDVPTGNTPLEKVPNFQRFPRQEETPVERWLFCGGLTL